MIPLSRTLAAILKPVPKSSVGKKKIENLHVVYGEISWCVNFTYILVLVQNKRKHFSINLKQSYQQVHTKT